jgi:hypothetical protein
MAHALQLGVAPGERMEKSNVQVEINGSAKQKELKPDPKALKILAKSIFRELRSQGYEPTQVVSFATEIISLVTSDIAGDEADASR